MCCHWEYRKWGAGESGGEVIPLQGTSSGKSQTPINYFLSTYYVAGIVPSVRKDIPSKESSLQELTRQWTWKRSQRGWRVTCRRKVEPLDRGGN